MLKATFRQLEIFVTAAECGAFGVAATKLGITQPAVSAQIASLERNLGYKLFARCGGKTPTLTAEGVRLFARLPAVIKPAGQLAANTAANADQ